MLLRLWSVSSKGSFVLNTWQQAKCYKREREEKLAITKMLYPKSECSTNTTNTHTHTRNYFYFILFFTKFSFLIIIFMYLTNFEKDI